MSFTSELQGFSEKAVAVTDVVRRKIILDLFSGIIQSTPVDTGRLAGNWQTTAQAPASDTVERIGPALAIAAIEEGISGPDQATYLTDNLPYAEVVEFGLYPDPPKKGTGKTVAGYSTRAPAGMVRINVARFQKIAEKAAVSISREVEGKNVGEF